MKTHRRRLITLLMHSGICAAAVFGALHAQAVTLGHSRVTSAPDQPLRIVVQVKDLNATDLKSITAQIAPVAAWQEAGLTPPVELNSLSTHLLPGHQEKVMQLVLQSRLVPADKVLDVLVDISTDASTQRHQVSVLQTQRPVSVQLAVTDPAKASKPSVPVIAPTPQTKTLTPATYTVKKGQNLYGIARTLRDERYNHLQLMAALVEANSEAFINGNMNLLRAGASLTIPDAATVAAISPQQARQIYQTQLEQFDEYRQRIAKGEPPVTVLSATKESNSDQDRVVSETSANTDRLQLSAQSDEEAHKDQQTATAQELAHTAQRLNQLEAVPSIEETHQAGFMSEPSDPDERILDQKPAALLESQNTTESKEEITSTVAVASATTASENEILTTESSSVSWWKSNAVALILSVFVLLVVLVAWFLRRTYATRMEYAEIVPASSVRTREKAETTEAEFREID